ncbi:hypothetical protein BV918_19505 [Pectobacterium odoriferum]|nr:hypothetical protein BV925_18545 [Pectobacterium odoriferum]POE16071.1 hypothetical protein BV918_19505 [Pectobacterium odoriferum]
MYPSYFKLHVRWLRSLTRITYVSKLIRIPSLAACLKLELFRVYNIDDIEKNIQVFNPDKK